MKIGVETPKLLAGGVADFPVKRKFISVKSGLDLVKTFNFASFF